MKLEKGSIIKKIRTNPHTHCESANTESTLIVERVNKTTYSVKYIDGHMKNTTCKMAKGFAEESIDEYGTVTRYEVIK